MKNTVKTFRMDEKMAEQWEKAIKATGAKDSELVRECILVGFQDAVQKLLDERKKAVDSLFLKGPKRPFNVPSVRSGYASSALVPA